jgi:hypothetical protein
VSARADSALFLLQEKQKVCKRSKFQRKHRIQSKHAIRIARTRHMLVQSRHKNRAITRLLDHATYLRNFANACEY